MELVELKIHGISYSDNTSGAFALILDEVNGNKKLPIVNKNLKFLNSNDFKCFKNK